MPAAAFTAPGATTWNVIPTTCHMATLFWLYEAEFGRRIATQADYLAHFPNPTLAMQGIMGTGRRLSRPMVGSLALTPNSVLIFERGGQPVHSCVAITANWIAGYNQLNWFTGVGANHNYSTHNTSEIKWRGVMHPQEVEGNVAGHWCHLIAVPEGTARARVRQLVQP